MDRINDITETLKGDVVIFHVKGKLDSTLSPMLERKAFEYFDAGQNKLLLDLEDVSYVNSAGLRMLLSLKKEVRSLSGKFVIYGLKTEILEIMKICGFDHVLEISNTEEDALRQF